MAWTLNVKHVVFSVVAWIGIMLFLNWQGPRTSDLKWKIRLVKAQFIILVEFLVLVGNYIIWKTFSPLPHLSSHSRTVNSLRPRHKNSDSDLSSLQNEIKEKNVAKKDMLSQENWTYWHLGLLVFMFLNQISYLTNIFLIGVEPHWFSVISYICLGMEIQCITGIVLMKGISFLVKFAKQKLIHKSKLEEADISQRKKISLILCYVLLSSTIGVYTAFQPPSVKRLVIPIQNLPENLNKLHIVQLSDIHLGPTVGYSKLKSIMKMVVQENPDLLVITGDLVDASVAKLKGATEPLSLIKPRYGKFYVTGNHEYYTGDVDNWYSHLRSIDIDVLHNSNIKIPKSVTGKDQQICLAGTDDVEADRINYGPNHGFDFKTAVKGCDEKLPVILLAHQPAGAKMALDTGVRLDLILSGHTHGGQTFPLSVLAYLTNPFFLGLYKIEGRDTHLYVSSGTQYWGIPMRFASSMEITSFTLTQKMS